MKKPLLLALTGVALGFGVFSYCSPQTSWPLTVDKGGVSHLVAFGDSLTAGTGVLEGETYPARLAAMTGLKVVNLGEGGDTTASALKRLDKVFEAKPEMVLLTLGGNDYLGRVPLNETIANLQQIFQRLHAANIMPIFLGIEHPTLGDNWPMAIQDLCREEGVLYVGGIMKGVWRDQALMRDQFHPNSGGYKVFAERVFKAIGPRLSCNGPAC